jgi:hypothetical protein
MKKGFTVLFCVLILLSSFLSCTPSLSDTGEGQPSGTKNQTAIPTATGEKESNKTEEKPTIAETDPYEEETEPPEEQTPPTENLPPVTTTHQHQWRMSSQTPSSCSVSGQKEYTCICGEKKKEAIPTLDHAYPPASCTEWGSCLSCGHQGRKPVGHVLNGKVCVNCATEITSPFFVLGRELLIDESPSSFTRKLGEPTEIITEGSFSTYVYASDLTRLTFIQTDEVGLWGIFTFDSSSFICLDGITLNFSSEIATEDPGSEAYYTDLSSYRIFSFRDRSGTGENYAMWVLCRELVGVYDFKENNELYSTYQGQNRISYYYVNALRARHSLSPLKWSDLAAEVATEYSAYMIENNFFNHDGSYVKRLQNKGVNLKRAGENISRGYANTFFVCDAYYNSPSHRSNILDTLYTHVGMGYQRQSVPQIVYGAQIFYKE